MFVARLSTLQCLICALSIVSSAKNVAARPSPDLGAVESGRSGPHVGAEGLATRDASRYLLDFQEQYPKPCLNCRSEKHDADHALSRTTSRLLEISITDTEGRDHSQSLQILHSPPSPSANNDNRNHPSLTKRGHSRLLDHCPGGETFIESHCREEVSPQSYVLKCTDGFDNSWYFRRCLPAEVCIQGIPKQHPPLANGQLVPPSLKAYCVATDSFQRIAQDAATHKTVPPAVGVKYSAPEGQNVAVEAVLTGTNMSESLFARSLRMSAQTSDALHDVRTWRSQVGGTAACADCARVWIAPVPSGTERIVLQVVLKTGAVGGLLFLSSVAI
ncbi:MAG: hypothetical protein LQ344_005627 [Seirophora lacunosa]|nr:MAG: hypothetical protein LQ344_005627 [Seirophora lacunosa]